MPTRKKRKTESRRPDGSSQPALQAPPLSELLAHRLKQIAFALILFGAAMGPLAPTLEASFILRLVLQLVFVLAGALWVFGVALDGKIIIRRTGTGLWLLILGGALLSGVVNASYKYPALLTAFTWGGSIIAFVFLLQEARSARTRLILLTVIGASAFIISLHGLHQLLIDLPNMRAAFERNPDALLRKLRLPAEMGYDFEGRLGSNRVFSTFLLPNSLAGFLALLLPACLGLTFDRLAELRRSETARPFASQTGGVYRFFRGAHMAVSCRLLLIVPIVIAFYLTKSKAGWLAGLLSLAVFAVWGFGKYLWRYRMHVLCTALSLLVVIFISQKSGLLPPLSDYVGSSQVRYGYWRAGVEAFGHHPYVGVGLDNFSDQYAKYKRAQDQDARRAHNDYIQLAVEIGLVGLFAYLMFLVRFWYRALHRTGAPVLPPTEHRAQEAHPFLLAFCLSVCVFAVEALCGGTLQSSAGMSGSLWVVSLWLAWLVFFLIFAGRQDVAGPVRGSYATIGMGCGVIAFLAHSLADMDHYVGGILQTAWLLMALLLASRLSEESVPEKEKQLLPQWRLALTLSSAGAVLLVLYGFVLPVAEGHRLREMAVDPASKLSLEQRERMMKASTDACALDAQAHALRSDMLLSMWMGGKDTIQGEISTLSEAIKMAGKATDLNPYRSEYFTRLGRLYERRWIDKRILGDYQNALAAYLQAEDLFPSNPDARLNLGRLYDVAGNHDLAHSKYFRARGLSGEQYYDKVRRLAETEMAELEARMAVLRECLTYHKPPPPVAFKQPRLRGLPARRSPMFDGAGRRPRPDG